MIRRRRCWTTWRSKTEGLLCFTRCRGRTQKTKNLWRSSRAIMTCCINRSCWRSLGRWWFCGFLGSIYTTGVWCCCLNWAINTVKTSSWSASARPWQCWCRIPSASKYAELTPSSRLRWWSQWLLDCQVLPLCLPSACPQDSAALPSSYTAFR